MTNKQTDTDDRSALIQTLIRTVDEQNELHERLFSIATLARQYNHAGVSPAAHELANRVLELATGERREYR
jgi:hypothetical protein